MDGLTLFLIEVLSDDCGINASAYNALLRLAETLPDTHPVHNILRAVKATDDRYYIPEGA